MHFAVGLQVNEHVFFNPWKYEWGFFSSNSVKRPVNVDHMIFFTHFHVIFLICAEANTVPLNL